MKQTFTKHIKYRKKTSQTKKEHIQKDFVSWNSLKDGEYTSVCQFQERPNKKSLNYQSFKRMIYLYQLEA